MAKKVVKPSKREKELELALRQQEATSNCFADKLYHQNKMIELIKADYDRQVTLLEAELAAIDSQGYALNSKQKQIRVDLEILKQKLTALN